MNGLPLHPAIVHLPVGLAFLMPLLAAGFGWAVVTGRVRVHAWLAVVALQGLLVASSLVAINTGQREEDRVEAVVSEGALATHEEAAEQFAWAAGATLVLTALVLLFRAPKATAALAAAAVLAMVVVGGLAVRVGHAGGQLVYSQGAAAVYALARPAGSPTMSAPAVSPGRESDDERGERRPGRR